VVGRLLEARKRSGNEVVWIREKEVEEELVLADQSVIYGSSFVLVCSERLVRGGRWS
jgi:hypothetical protein